MSEGTNSDLDSQASLSVVQVQMPNQSMPVQSVIQQNNQSLIQTAGHNSVIQTTGQGVPTIQVVRVAQVEEDLSDDSEGRKRREILSRRPSYRSVHLNWCVNSFFRTIIMIIVICII